MDMAIDMDREAWRRFTVIEAKRLIEFLKIGSNSGFVTGVEMALKKAWKSFENILRQFLSILIIIGIILAILSPNTISMLVGQEA